MSTPTKINNLNRLTFKHAALCTAAVLLLPLFPRGRAGAQSAPGPLPGATPSDQPSATAPAGSSAQVAGKPNLAGTWKLNADQSDNPMQKMRQAQQDSGGQGGGGGLGQLVIEQTPTSTKVSDSSGRVLALYLASPEQGGSQSSPANSSNNDTNATPVAQWQDSRLVTTEQMRNGGTTTRTYEMSPDNKQLFVTTKVENKRFKEPVTFRLVYDPVYASTGGD